MGGIADMMINGDMDYETGEYLGFGDGYPRRKKRKSDNYNPKSGIIKYVKRLGITDKMSIHKLCVKYIHTDKFIHDDLNKNNVSWNYVANLIQKDFKSFKDYVQLIIDEHNDIQTKDY